MSGGETGAAVGYQFCKRRNVRKKYSPEDFIMLRRTTKNPLPDTAQRIGSVQFLGSDALFLRNHAYEQVRVVLIVGGGAGTLKECKLARQKGLGIIPLACTGGSASKIWNEMLKDLPSYKIGGSPISKRTFRALNSKNSDRSVAAAQELVKQAFFLA